METDPSLHVTEVTGMFSFQPSPLLRAFHCALVPLKVMVASPVQPSKASSPILVTLAGIVMLVRPVQRLKEEPMLV